MAYERLTERVGVLTGGVNIGVLHAGDGRVALIDSGTNESNARKTLRTAREELGAEVGWLLTTHAHADHIGGHAFLASRTGAEVIAPPMEAALVEHPLLMASLLYGGAAPPPPLRERFILAAGTPVHRVIDGDHLEIGELTVEVVRLPGHSPGQVGYAVDGVFFCADVVFPAEGISRFRVPYLYDLTAHLASLERAETVSCSHVVAGHGPIERRVDAAVAANLAIVDETIAAILERLVDPMPLDALCAALFDAMDVPITGHIGYYLLRPTVAAYLAHLEASGQVRHEVDGRQAVWVLTT